VARLDALLQVSDLQTHFFTFGGTRVVKAVDRVSFALQEGETLGLVGDDDPRPSGQRDRADDALTMYREMDIRFWPEQAEVALRELG